MAYDLHSNSSARITIPFASRSQPVTATAVSLRGYSSAEIIFMTGTVAAGTIDFTLQHADDDGAGSPDTWSDVPADAIIGTVPQFVATNDNAIATCGYRIRKEWLRVAQTETATWTGANFGAIVFRGSPGAGPV